jgi:multicomponent Na+:H+ antiporter subunit D
MSENANPLIVAVVFVPLLCSAFSILAARNLVLQRLIALTGLGACLIFSIILLITNIKSGPQIYRLGGWPSPYGIVLVADMLSSLFVVMAAVVLFAGIIYSIGCKDDSVSYPAYTPLFLAMSTGLCGALLTGDIFTLFVFVELMVMSSVVMVAISDNRLGLEAAMKYLLISGMGSLFLLIGIGSLYATYGTLTLADIARLITASEIPALADTGAVMLICAFLLKSAVFPFHFWQPDFHTTAPTPVGSMLSSVVVKVGVYGLIRILTLVFIVEAPVVRQLLIVLGLIGIFFGSLGALRTYNAKRLLAYSTFGQVGFILVGIGWGNPVALIGAIIYAFNHSLIKASLLMITGAVASRIPSKSSAIESLVGVGSKLPYLSGLYFAGGLALAGVPPLNGFISKLSLIQGGIVSENWLVLGLVVGSGLLTLFYMMRTWQIIFQRTPPEKTEIKHQGDSLLAPSLLIGLCILLGIYAAPLVDAATMAVNQISNPRLYIAAVLGM